MAIQSFKNQGTEDVHYGRNTKQALRLLPSELHKKAQVKLARLSAASNLHDLRTLPGKQYSIRINDQYRICFQWQGEQAILVEVADYH